MDIHQVIYCGKHTFMPMLLCLH